jgi:5-formaminoimidazole-4-carboxamide-1-beta-D-ribofuranosyl 5'-monophosphate synthetase
MKLSRTLNVATEMSAEMLDSFKHAMKLIITLKVATAMSTETLKNLQNFPRIFVKRRSYTLNFNCENLP